MKITRLLFVVLLQLAIIGAGAQSLDREVSLRYSSEPLGRVLEDISRTYQVRFSYSRDYIPLEKGIFLDVQGESLSMVLDDICNQASLDYMVMGGQVLLKPGASDQQLGKLETRPGKLRQTSPLYPEPVDEQMMAERERLKRHLLPLQEGEKKKAIKGEGYTYREISPGLYRVPVSMEVEAGNERNDDTRLAQISLLPFIGTNALRSDQITNNFSLNLLWGSNGGVEGVEVGGFVNSVKNDVHGVQVAGLGSIVGGEVKGSQVGGLFNVTKHNTTGLQVAGLFSVTQGAMAGVQVSGMGNITGGRAEGLQVAGLFNISGGESRTQFAGLFNIAGDVKGGQASAVFNTADRVDGFQIGLINVADTINGVPVGLLNIVRHGYNRVELSGNDALFANLSIKLGAYSFYNIFHAGARWDDSFDPASGRRLSWGLGYGLGTAIVMNPRMLLNIEAVAIHVNEQEGWTDELNLLNQARFSLDFHKAGNSTSLFIGPILNVMVSKVVEPETGLIGSRTVVPSYTLLDETNGNTNVKMWAGLQGGIRF